MTRICENPTCQNRYTPKRPHGRYCSDYCRYADWDAKHPRMAADSRATEDVPYAAAALARQAAAKLGLKDSTAKVLAVLYAGRPDVTTGQFLAAGVGRLSARIQELREVGYEIQTERIENNQFKYRIASEPARLGAGHGASENQRTTASAEGGQLFEAPEEQPVNAAVQDFDEAA